MQHHKYHKHDIIVILAVFGMLVAMYLTTAHYLGYIPPCDLTHGCDIVLTSKYSMLLGFPLALWGVGFFLSVIISALLANHYPLWRKILTTILAAGSLASLIFISLQFFVLKKVCQYCLTTDILTIVILLVDINIDYLRRNL